MKSYFKCVGVIAALGIICGSINFACTEQVRAKSYGGTTTVTLPKGEKLVNVTWKEANIWYLTRPMTDSDVAETYKFREKSNFGKMEGTIVLQEQK